MPYRKGEGDILVDPGQLVAGEPKSMGVPEDRGEPAARPVPEHEGEPASAGVPGIEGEPEATGAPVEEGIEFVAPDAELQTQPVLPCGHPFKSDIKFCPECGAPVRPAEPEPWECGNGHANVPIAKFCPECGAERPGLSISQKAVGAPVQQRPRPESELTTAQLAERERAHAEALRLGAQMPRQQYLRAMGENRALFHFLEDGHYAFGNVWYRGQEAEVDLDGPRGAEAREMLAMDDFRQMRELGKVKFRQGPWPGLSYADGAGRYQKLASPDGSEISGPSVEELLRAQATEQARGRAVPAPVL